jgi:hypothetical protein
MRPLTAEEGEGAMAEFTLEAKAHCSDGLCGEVSRTILDPATRTVTHLVVEPRHRRGSGRLVPVHLVDEAAGEIRLRCTFAEFDRLDPAEEFELVEDGGYDGGYGQAEAVQGYGNVGSMGVGTSASDGGQPRGSAGGHRGGAARARPCRRRRDRPGRRLVVNAADHTVTHVLLREGHLWGRKEVAIPVSAVASVDAGIRLNITKKQVEDLPPVEL